MSLRQEQKRRPGGWFCGAEGFSTSPSLRSVIKSPHAGSGWALVNPFNGQPAHRASPRTSPAPFHPPATRVLGARCHPGHSACSTLHLPVHGSLPNSVPHPATFLTPLLVPALPSLWKVFLQEDRPLDPSYFSFCFPVVTAPRLVHWGSLQPGALWIVLPWHERTRRARPRHARTPSSLAIDAGGKGG